MPAHLLAARSLGPILSEHLSVLLMAHCDCYYRHHSAGRWESIVYAVPRERVLPKGTP